MTILCAVFLGLATWNLGLTQTPNTTATLSSGQSFYLDLEQQQYVSSIHFLLKDGSFNLSVYSGTSENWHMVTSGVTFSDYYKWKEVSVSQTTQYLKVDFGQSSPEAILAEVAVAGQDNEQLVIKNITGIDDSNLNLKNLVDEQDKVELPTTYMSQTYFDEIYFVRTAEQYLHLQSPYEWTHPPLGKLIQAVGITIFGYSPFGWRFTGVLFATAMIPVMYLLGKRLFDTWIGAFAAAFLLTFDFMHFAMGRMGTADTYVVFFSLLSQLSFFIYFSNVVKNGWKTSVLPLFAAVMFFILGFSTKWLVLYGAVGMLALLVGLRIREIRKLRTSLGAKYAAFFDHPFLLLLGFIALAVGIYFVIYIPDMLTGRPLLGTYGNGVIDLQFAMYNYHATLVAEHAFASPWWSWPFMVSFSGYVPLWLEVSYLPNSIVSTTSVFGNPAVWWIGFIAMIFVSERAVRGKELVLGLRRKISRNKKPISDEQSGASSEASALLATEKAEQPSPSDVPTQVELQPAFAVEMLPQSSGRNWDIASIFIAVVFFFSWVPYVFISRVTFIYHFYISVPFLCLASAYFINKGWGTRKGKIATIVFFAAVIALFVAFYPVISGVPTPTSYIHNLKWFPSWFFAP